MLIATVGTPFDDGLANDVTENIMCSLDSTHVGLLWREDPTVSSGRFQFWLDVLTLASDGLSLSRTARAILIDQPSTWAETNPGHSGGFPQMLSTDFGAVAMVQAQPPSGSAIAEMSLVDSAGAINATLSLTVVDGFDYWIMFPVNGTTIGLLHVDDTQHFADVHTLRVGSSSLTLDPTITATIDGCSCTQGPINGGGCFLGMSDRFHNPKQAYVATDPGSGPLVLTAVSTVEQYEEGPAANFGCIGPNPGQGVFLSLDSASSDGWVVIGHQSGGTFVTDSKVLFTDRLRLDFGTSGSNGPMLVNRAGQIDIGSIPAGGVFGTSNGEVILDLFGDAVMVNIGGSNGSAQFLAAPAAGRLVAAMGWFGLVVPIAISSAPPLLTRVPDTAVLAEVRTEARLVPGIRMDGG